MEKGGKFGEGCTFGGIGRGKQMKIGRKIECWRKDEGWRKDVTQ